MMLTISPGLSCWWCLVKLSLAKPMISGINDYQICVLRYMLFYFKSTLVTTFLCCFQDCCTEGQLFLSNAIVPFFWLLLPLCHKEVSIILSQPRHQCSLKLNCSETDLVALDGVIFEFPLLTAALINFRLLYFN